MLSNSCKWQQKNNSILFFVICQTPLKERGISIFRAKNLLLKFLLELLSKVLEFIFCLSVGFFDLFFGTDLSID